MVTRLIFPLLLALAACGGPSERSTQPTEGFAPGTSAIVDPQVILHATCGKGLDIQPDTAAWTPTPDIVARLEPSLLQTLETSLARFASEYEVTTLRPYEYYRRYAGIMRAGQRVIAICGEARVMYDTDAYGGRYTWPEQFIPLRDGGEMTFGAYFDPETGTITDFGFGYMA